MPDRVSADVKAFLHRQLAAARRVLHRSGFDLVRYVPADFDADEQAVVRAVAPFTMTGPLRVQSLVQGVRHVVDAGIEGALVECGVWRGGSMMAAALSLKTKRTLDRDLYLFDTFDGMTAPSDEDRDFSGAPAEGGSVWRDAAADSSGWCAAGLEEVRANLIGTGYPPERIHLVQGRVEETLPTHAPDHIALLRLDTDWYESTKHEMEHLFPRLERGGVLILDDYGHWQGSRRAVDEYLASQGLHLLLQRIDYTGRIAIKTE